jgi:hypothetical protein
MTVASGGGTGVKQVTRNRKIKSSNPAACIQKEPLALQEFKW